jgi:hypothetical protein
MPVALNQEAINDIAKLIMHRLVVRSFVRNPALIVRAQTAHAYAAKRFSDRQFVRDWNDILARPVSELRYLLIRRGPDLDRLRSSSPFAVADGFDFTDRALRRRIWGAARRLASHAAHRSFHADAKRDRAVS